MSNSLLTIRRFILLLAALSALARLSSAQATSATDTPDLQLKEFRLHDLEASLKSMHPGPDHDYFAGMLANRLNHLPDSIQLLNAALPALRARHPDRAVLALKALADGYSKQFQYADAARAFDDVLAHFSAQLDKEQLRGTKDDAQIAQILKDAPPQSISITGPVSLKTRRNPLNSQNVELVVNGVAEQWLLDTGANLSVVTKSLAARLGLQPLPGAAETQAGLTGIENPLRVTLIPALNLGGATLHNVVVMILDDANLNINLGKLSYQIQGIIGYPVFQALGSITFLHDGGFQAGAAAPSNRTGVPLYMKELGPVIECKVEGQSFPFTFDTGASDSTFGARYLEQFRSESKSWKKGNSLSAGAGGVVKQDVYIQPRLQLGIGDREVTLEKVTINQTSAGTDREELYGNLGQDVVANFDRFTIDFSNMVFYLGDPLPATKEKP